MKKFDELYAIATRKSQYDQTNTWFKGVETYLEAIGKLSVLVRRSLSLHAGLRDGICT